MKMSAHLPDQEPPCLLVPPKMGNHLDIEEVLRVCDASENRQCYDPKEKRLRDVGSSKAGGKHCSGLRRRKAGKRREFMAL